MDKKLYVIFLEKKSGTTNIHVYLNQSQVDTVRANISKRQQAGLIVGGVCYPVAVKDDVNEAVERIEQFAPLS